MSEKPKNREVAVDVSTQERGYSEPSILKKLTLRSEFCIRAMDTFVKPTAYALYRLDVILYFMGSEEFADTVNSKANEKIQGYLAAFEKRDQALEKKMTDDIDVNQLGYSDPLNTEFEINSPLGASYLKMIQSMEMCTNKVDCLWLNLKMDSNKRSKEVKRLSGMLKNFSGELMNLSYRAWVAAKHAGKKEDIVKALTERNIPVGDIDKTYASQPEELEPATEELEPATEEPEMNPEKEALYKNGLFDDDADSEEKK